MYPTFGALQHQADFVPPRAPLRLNKDKKKAGSDAIRTQNPESKEIKIPLPFHSNTRIPGLSMKTHTSGKFPSSNVVARPCSCSSSRCPQLDRNILMDETVKGEARADVNRRKPEAPPYSWRHERTHSSHNDLQKRSHEVL